MRVPDYLALVGFDDSPLTTVHQPTETMGRERARLLVEPGPFPCWPRRGRPSRPRGR
ncbi:substrate-binding domain-containing protein [Glycomyces dulcitolivorans]|uniref:substrate-binding domain-containing protein n=1 Tax=Glycomyces dulcitolivorans TaxID=2200759 RepID=UPI000DD4A81F|nr:substrate-binding domain-containing protein [Glycomyces dulcitolivorans]